MGVRRERLLNVLVGTAAVTMIAGTASELPNGPGRLLLIAGGFIVATCFWLLPVRP